MTCLLSVTVYHSLWQSKVSFYLLSIAKNVKSFILEVFEKSQSIYSKEENGQIIQVAVALAVCFREKLAILQVSGGSGNLTGKLAMVEETSI